MLRDFGKFVSGPHKFAAQGACFHIVNIGEPAGKIMSKAMEAKELRVKMLLGIFADFTDFISCKGSREFMNLQHNGDPIGLLKGGSFARPFQGRHGLFGDLFMQFFGELFQFCGQRHFSLSHGGTLDFAPDTSAFEEHPEINSSILAGAINGFRNEMEAGNNCTI
jgi:hypothetical protein